MAYTYFYRDIYTLEISISYLQNFKNYDKIICWDAGCAMGPEPYTFLLLLAELPDKTLFEKVELHVSDIDTEEEFLETLKKGEYKEEDIHRVPPHVLAKYFVKVHKKYVICDEIRAKLFIHQHDLLSLKPIQKGFHLVLCKNVLLHFLPMERIDVYSMFRDSLVTGGFLVTEPTQKMPEQLQHHFVRENQTTQIWKKK